MRVVVAERSVFDEGGDGADCWGEGSGWGDGRGFVFLEGVAERWARLRFLLAARAVRMCLCSPAIVFLYWLGLVALKYLLLMVPPASLSLVMLPSRVL